MTDVQTLACGVIAAGIRGGDFDPSLPPFGAYVIFNDDGAPLTTIRALTDALRARAGTSVLVAVDQEGGAVMRLRGGAEPIPPTMALGAAGDLDLARRAGEQIAFDLRRAGCTLDFAPVLDLALDAANTVIGTRSLGSDPNAVAALGEMFARGLSSGGIVPCFKHFPGHGSSEVDSHQALPRIDCSEERLQSRDLVPFAAVARRAEAMMTGHLFVPAIDSQWPASLSPPIAGELLRNELGFNGALFTDCLEMGALSAHDDADIAVRALAAGADMLVYSHRWDRAAAGAESIARAVDEGRLTLQRLQEANARVATLRRHDGAPLPVEEFAPHPDIGREIARRAITLVRGVARADPVASIAVAFGGETSLPRESPALAEVALALEPAPEEVEALFAELDRRGRRPLVLTRRAHRYPLQAAAVKRVLGRYPDAVVVSLREPFDLPLFDAARHLLAAYGDDAASIGGLADVLFGSSMPAGRLPVGSAT